MQGAEMEDEGSVLKYMTQSEIEEQRSSLLIMTQRLFCVIALCDNDFLLRKRSPRCATTTFLLGNNRRVARQ